MTIAFFSNPSIAIWMLYTTGIGCLITLGAFAGHDAQKAFNQPLRWIWIAAIGLIATLSMAAPFRDQSMGSVADDTFTQVTRNGASATFTPHSSAGTWSASLRDAIVASLRLVLRGADRLIGEDLDGAYRALAVLWLALSVTVIAGFVLSYRRTMRHVRRLRRVEIGGVSVRVSPSLGPAVVGLVASQIVVPEWLISRSPDEQRMAVTHEAEHIRAADPWLLVAACVAVALFPWNPTLWYCLSRLRLAMELDCDRRVLQRGVAPSEYGSLLIELSANRPVLPLVMPAFPGSQSHLERRLITMTDRTVSFRPVRRIAGSLLAATLLIAACESRLPTAGELDRMDVASVEKQASPVRITSTVPVQYLVDGKPVDAQVAKALKSSEISSITVIKSTGGNPGQIRISTLPDAGLGVGPSRVGVLDEKRADQITSGVSVAQAADKSAFAGLLIVDGVMVDASVLKTIRANRIASIEVMKSAAATRRYNDPRAADGLIMVTTKR
jgi:bla regulator protein blaR1